MTRRPVKAPAPVPAPRRMRFLDRLWFRDYRITYAEMPRRVFWFTPTELQHLAVGVLLVLAVGLSALRPNLPLFGLVAASIIVAAAFIVHELAHKFLAQSNGLWAEFRTNIFGALLTLMSIFSPFKIIVPGAVMIAGPATMDVIGRVALIGPVTNVAMALMFLGLAGFAKGMLLAVADIGVYVNGLLALFNLLPLGILDGHKVFLWSKRAWAIAFLISVGIFVLATI